MSDERERLAVVETDLKYIKKTLDRVNTNVELLMKERYESIGKKAILSMIFGAIGAGIIALLSR